MTVVWHTLLTCSLKSAQKCIWFQIPKTAWSLPVIRRLLRLSDI